MPVNANAYAVSLDQAQNCVRNMMSESYSLTNEQAHIMFNVASQLRTSWYGPKAVQTVDPFMENYFETLKSISGILMSMIDKVLGAARNYATACGEDPYSICGDYRGMGPFCDVPGAVPTKLLQAGPNGEVGISDKTGYQNAITMLKNAKTKMQDHLTAISNSAQNTGFMDGGTEAAIADECARLKTQLYNTIEGLTKELEAELNENKETLESVQNANIGSFGA